MDSIDKLPPQNIDSEKALLGYLLAGQQIDVKVKPEYFYLDKHKLICRSILAGNIDIVSCSDYLSKKLTKDKFLEIGGNTYLTNLVNSAAINPEKHFSIIYDAYSRRKIIEEANKTIQFAYNQNIEIPKQKKSDFEIVSGCELLKMEIKERPYIIEKLIPENAITALTADSGKGKSLVALIMAYYVASGKKFLDTFETKQGKVLIIDQEMDSDVIKSRFKAICKKEVLPIDYLYESFWLIDEKDDYKWLIDQIKKSEYKFVIFDTLTAIHNRNENSSDEMKIVNRQLLNIINETGVTILYLHHHRKRLQGEGFNQSSSRGSTEIIAKVASHLLLDSKQWIEDEITQLEITLQQEKSRRPESINKIGLKIFYDPHMKETFWEYMGEIDDKGKKIEQAKEFVLEALQAGEWLSVGELKNKGVNIGESNLREACKELAQDKILNVEMGSKLGKDQKRAKYYSLAI